MAQLTLVLCLEDIERFRIESKELRLLLHYRPNESKAAVQKRKTRHLQELPCHLTVGDELLQLLWRLLLYLQDCSRNCPADVDLHAHLARDQGGEAFLVGSDGWCNGWGDGGGGREGGQGGGGPRI